MAIQANRPVSKQSQKSFFNSRSFTIILTVGSLVVTGLVGGLFEYLGGQLAQNATTSSDPFDNPQPNVFTEWLNRPDFIRLRAKFEAEDKPFSFWDIGYWIDEIEGKVIGDENKFRFKYVDNPDFLDGNPWHWEFNISDKQFQILNEKFMADGFKLYKRQEFIGTNNQNLNQAIWRIDPQHVSRAPKAPLPKAPLPKSMDTNVELPKAVLSESKQSNKKISKVILTAIGKAGFDSLDKNRDGLLSLAEYPGWDRAKTKTFFDRQDKNKDGLLSFKEWFKQRLTVFTKIDHNQDEVVSLAEYVLEHKGMEPEVIAEAKAFFLVKDRDGNGEIDLPEWQSATNRREKNAWQAFDKSKIHSQIQSPGVIERVVSGQEVLQSTESNTGVAKEDKSLKRARGAYKWHDSNGDGKISADDIQGSPQGKQAKITNTIKRLDKDGDRSVSFDEFLLDQEKDYSNGTVFSDLDKDKDNFLSLSEFLTRHKENIEKKTEEFKQLDQNADERLSFEEFRKS